MEYVEESENRSPNDVDVVTFAHLPEGKTQQQSIKGNENLFNPKETKKDFKVDAYFVQLGIPIGIEQVSSVSYWYSMWSHRRDSVWKGFIQVDLSPNDDEQARVLLEQMKEELNYVGT